jgi:thiol-disulfide isomerase/thioredoxin
MRGPGSQFVNQHSYVLIALTILVIAAAISLLLRRRRLRMGIVGGLAVALILVFAFLRTGSGDIRSPADLDASLRAGRPVAIEFYSDYCVACLAAKPVFADLEREFAGRATFLRANLRSEAGRALAARYKVDTVPAFLAFGGQGQLVLQLVGDPGVPVAELRRVLGAASGPTTATVKK